MKIIVIDESKPNIRWEYNQEPRGGVNARKWLKDGTQDKIVAVLQEALDEAKYQYLLIETSPSEDNHSNQKQSKGVDPTNTDETVMAINKNLFKDVLQLALKSPEFADKVTTVDIDSATANANEVTITLKPSDFLLRLSTTLGADR
ncbi:hypothetical protein [Arsenophonus nasoniae]|uniref:hypothetical protein n=1 Tax=Arsenophonus nasoniae TaxID=638 RepID=UPI003879318C